MDYKKALKGCSNTTNNLIILLTHQPNAARLVLNDKSVGTNIDLILSGNYFCIQDAKAFDFFII